MQVSRTAAFIVLFLCGIFALPGVSIHAQFREGADLGVRADIPRNTAFRAAAPVLHWQPADSLTVEHPGAGKKLAWLTGAALGMALFDYVGFNLVRDNDTWMPVYRVIQGLTQLAVSWLLYEQLGLPTAVAFNVLWWTWGLDALFYGYTELFNVGGEWHGRGIFQSDIMDNNCTWASWTPVGIARGMDSDRKIAGDTLIAQSLIGAILAVTITVGF